MNVSGQKLVGEEHQQGRQVYNFPQDHVVDAFLQQGDDEGIGCFGEVTVLE